MNKNLLINLSLCFSLLFCLAFACNDGGDSGGSAPTKRTGQNTAGGAITEQEVKNYIHNWWMKDCEACEVDYLTPVRINPKERHTFGNGVTVDAYPVKVDFDASGSISKGGIYYFYRNSFGEWEMGQEGVDWQTGK